MRIYFQTIIAVLILLVLGVLGFHVFTYDHMHMMYMTSKYTLPVAVVVTLALFLFEESGDERIREHQKKTDRTVLAAVVLLLGSYIIYQVFTSMVDPVLVIIFSVTLIVKILLRWVYYFFE